MTRERRTPSPIAKSFGRYVKRLRKDRGHTQEQLAELAGLASDTIRRLEHGSFSPSLDTLSKLAAGLRLDLSALFTVFEHGDGGRERELVAMARTLSPTDLALVLRLLAFVVGLLGGIAAERGERVADKRGGEHE
jgi:transcriptional regulator with XRE-family HTH domain